MKKILGLAFVLFVFSAVPTLAACPATLQLKDNAGATPNAKYVDDGSGNCQPSVIIGVNQGEAGTPQTGQSQPTGGVGLSGWLSGIYNRIVALVTAVGTPMQQTGGSVTANAGTNLNTSSLALETGGNLAQVVTDFGPPGATACASDTASCNANQQMQRLAQRLTSIVTALGSPFQAGGSIGNTTFASTQSGTWTVQPGNTANTTAWLFNMGSMGGTAINSGCVSNYGTAPSAVACPSATVFVSNATPGIANNADAIAAVAASSTSPVPVNSYPYLFNGTTWDRARSGTQTGSTLTNGATNVTATDCSGTVVTGGTAVNAFTAQTTLHGFTIFNTNTSEVMWISFTTTAAASTAGSYPIPAATATTFAGGGSFTSPPGFGLNHALSVVAATSAHSFSCTWW